MRLSVKQEVLGASPRGRAISMPTNAKSRRLAFQASVRECESLRGCHFGEALDSTENLMLRLHAADDPGTLKNGSKS